MLIASWQYFPRHFKGKAFTDAAKQLVIVKFWSSINFCVRWIVGFRLWLDVGDVFLNRITFSIVAGAANSANFLRCYADNSIC